MHNIFWWPHFTLTRVAEELPLGQVNTGLFLNRVSTLYEMMYRHKGVGLAAPQVGWNKRVMVMNPYGRTAHNRGLSLINPQIICGPNLEYDTEGCLSLPGIYAKVARPNEVYVKSLLPNGKSFEGEFRGFSSRIVLHEYDHLEGICFVDRLEPDELSRIQPELDGLRNFIEGIRKKREEKEKEKKANQTPDNN